MVNKRVTPIDDPLVHVDFLIKQSQKNFLDELGKSGRSAFIRKLLDAQMDRDPYAIETGRLEEENRRLEAQMNINKAQIKEHKEELIKQQAASQTMEQLLNKAAERLVTNNRSINFKDHGFIRMFNNNLEMLNKDSNCNGESVTAEQLKTLIIQKAKVQEKRVYDD